MSFDKINRAAAQSNFVSTKNFMALNNPPPYFPQSSLSPSDPNRYRKFKLIVAAVIVALLVLLVGAGVGIFYLVKSLL